MLKFSNYFGNRWFASLLAVACMLTKAPLIQPNLYADEPQRELATKPSNEADLVFFEKSIRPLLATHCYECHSANATKIKASLMLDSRQRMLKGGDSGTALVPSKADESPIIEAVKYLSNEMPPKGKLPDADIENLIKWVNMGAPWPEEAEPLPSEKKNTFDLNARKQSHWMWQPVHLPSLPKVSNGNWPLQPLDRFILSKLESSDLKPAPPIDRRGLIRRLSFDLLGLPPSAEDTDRFAEDGSSTSTEELVDALLKSPHFGERWGRHWLDLVRYAESRGHEFDADTPNAYQYRDYVIRALNADVPYDQFVREHIAGDLLPNPRVNPDSKINESVLGTGFWHLGEWVHSPVDIRKDESDRFDNMVDVATKAFLGVTVTCARCHDHKFDAISARDYYSMTGFLQGSQYRQVRFETMEQERHISAELKKLDANYASQVEKALVENWSQNRPETIEKLRAKVTSAGGKVELPWPRLLIPTLASSDDSSELAVDYTSDKPSLLNQDGFIFGANIPHPAQIVLREVDATPTVQLALGSSVRNDAFWNGLIAKGEKPINMNSRIETMPRPGRTLLTPTFEVKHGTVSCLVRGNGFVVACVDSHRLVAGPLHGGTIQDIKRENNQVGWIAMNLTRYVGHRIHLEFTPAENQTLEIFGVRDGKKAESVVATKTEPARDPDSIETIEEIASKIDKAIEAWKDRNLATKASDGDCLAATNWLLSNSKILFACDPDGRSEIDRIAIRWADARKELRSRLPNESAIAVAMIDSTGEDDRVLIRGNSAAPGDVTPRRFLEAIDGGSPLKIENGSGRLQLAERMNDPSNPLTSRVIVNRVWHHLLGRGIVPTVDDFGVLGQMPSNPELLDHLAEWFNRNGKSIKGLIRYIVLSQTYQMSSQVSDQSLAIDPKNTLWQHVAPKRLSGEAIRDSLLAISGELDSKMYGPSVPIFLSPFMDGRGRPSASGPLDGSKRRSIYIAVRRNFLSPFMLTFDTPNPFSTMGKRNVSNVPAQSLILMNDPFVGAEAHNWAVRTLKKELGSDTDRIQWMYKTAFARPPTSRELQTATQFIQEQSRQRGAAAGDIGVWSDFAHVLINLKEFVFLR